MGMLNSTVAIYERIRRYKYQIEVPALNLTFILSFAPRHYHHLAGLQHLTDIHDVANPLSTYRFYRALRRGQIDTDAIMQSALIGKISERLANFQHIENMLTPGDAKIIVSFDKHLADSNIEAVFYLFRREGNPFRNEPVTYYHLFIGQDDQTKQYYPATFIVEHSSLYASGQEFYDCHISIV